jgi:hypothetical protein
MKGDRYETHCNNGSFCFLAVAAVALAADPWIGTWKLNPDKSKALGANCLTPPQQI